MDSMIRSLMCRLKLCRKLLDTGATLFALFALCAEIFISSDFESLRLENFIVGMGYYSLMKGVSKNLDFV